MIQLDETAERRHSRSDHVRRRAPDQKPVTSGGSSHRDPDGHIELGSIVHAGRANTGGGELGFRHCLADKPTGT
jgi:hypothetical protein